MNGDTIKIICYGIAGILALYLFMLIFPYLIAFLAMVGAWYLWQEYQKSKPRKP